MHPSDKKSKNDWAAVKGSALSHSVAVFGLRDQALFDADEYVPTYSPGSPIGAGASNASVAPRNIGKREPRPFDLLCGNTGGLVLNTTWGDLLAEKDIAGIYRVQSSGKVRLSVHAEPHEGLGVSSYAWTTSPLRRYVDLVNQWQLVAGARGRRPPFARNSESLLAALRAFEVTSAAFDEHQRAMEQYWCLRWLVQERIAQAEGVVLRENLVRLDRLPLSVRVPSLPELEPGTRVRLAVEPPDLIERTVACAWQETLGQESA